jgi:uncharacterized membrane protein
MKKNKYLDLIEISVIAALYVVLTIVVQPISFREIQFRLSEILMLLVFYNRKYSVSLILGCLIANLWSPYLLWDMIFGTLATALSCLFMVKSKSLIVASIWPTIFNALIVGAEIAILSDISYLFCILTVGFGELVVVTVFGTIVFKTLKQNPDIKELICR